MTGITNVDAHARACEIIKAAGFEMVSVASNSESCYYAHPSRKPLLIRVSMHKSDRSPIGLRFVVARLTFTAKDTPYLSDALVLQRVRWAIGQYFTTEPRPSEYRGKRGTWESDQCQQLK